MAQPITFDERNTSYAAYLKQLLTETAEEFRYRRAHGTVSSPELSILQRIEELWPSLAEEK